MTVATDCRFNEKQSLCSKEATPGSLQICNLPVEKSNVGTSTDSQVRNTRYWEVYGEPILLPSQEINLCLIILSPKVTGMTFKTILTTSQKTHRASIAKVTS